MPTSDQLLDLDGVSRRSSTIRYDLLDATLTKIGELSPDRDAPPSITNNMNRTIKRVMEGMHLEPAEAADVDTISDRVRPVWVLSNGAEYNLGVFLWADASRLRFSYGLELEGSLVDQTLILDQALAFGYSLPKDTSITAALASLAQFAGFSGAEVEIASSGRTIGNPVAWPVGTSMFSIMAELCGMIGFFSPYFNNDGVLVMEPATDLSAATADHVYESGGRIIAGSMVESDDLLTAPNRYIVIGSGANDSEVYGTFDVPDAAPYSFVNRGFYVTDVWESQGITNTAQAEDAAAARYAQDGNTYRWVDFESTPDPRHDTFDVVQYLGDLYREQEWVLQLREGSAMRHSLRRIY